VVPGRVGVERLAAADLIGGRVKWVALRILLVAAVIASTPVLVGEVAAAQEQLPTPTVELIAPGRAPLEPIRLSPPTGAVQRSTMTVDFSIQQSGVSSARVKPPPVRATIETTLQGTTPDGNLQVTFSYPSFDLLRGGDASASERRRFKQAFAGLTGLSGQLTLTPQGVLVDSSLNVPPDLDPSVSSVVTQLGDQLRTLSIPFPAEAVGVGGRWRAMTDLSLNGIQARQVYEYTLKKRTGGTLVIGVTGTQTADRQTVDLPNVASGARLEVRKFKTTFRGENTVELASVLPTASQVRSNGDQTFRIQAGNNSGTLSQHLTVRLVVKPA
jgi:hypothetical protein